MITKPGVIPAHAGIHDWGMDSHFHGNDMWVGRNLISFPRTRESTLGEWIPIFMGMTGSCG
jgi:hypothetical protein